MPSLSPVDVLAPKSHYHALRPLHLIGYLSESHWKREWVFKVCEQTGNKEHNMSSVFFVCVEQKKKKKHSYCTK